MPARDRLPRRIGVLLLLLPLFAWPAAALAQGQVISVRARVDVADDDTPTRVALDYRLRPDTLSSRVPLRGVGFFGTRFHDVTARTGGEALPVRLQTARPPVVEGVLELPDAAWRGALEAGELTLRLEYDLAGVPPVEGRFDVVIPILLVDWNPVGAERDLFLVEALLPPDRAVVDAFPTVPIARRPVEAGVVHELRLPATPSMVRFRGREGDAPRLPFGRWVDLGVLAGLALLGLLAWRGLREA